MSPAVTTDTAALRALLDAASPRPWVGNERGSIAWMIRERADGPQVGNVICEEDAALIVAAVNELPALLNELETLREALNRAVSEGRNVLPDATDDQASVIERWAQAALDRVPR